MILKVTKKIRCPHCGKNITVNLDLSTPEETWIEDCQICKRSIHFSSVMNDGKITVSAERSK